MIRMLAQALLLSIASGAAAQSPPPSLVCGSPDVLGFVAERLHRAGQSTTIDAASIGQAPERLPGIVHCAVRVHTVIYDTARFRTAPADRVTIYRFSLNLRHNAIFLADDP